MPLFHVELDSGIRIIAVQILQCETYEGGLAIGRHTEERVSRTIEEFTRMARRIVPASPVTALLPGGLGEDGGWCLPFFACVTWFTSEPVHNEGRCGSHLATLHFQDTPQPYFSPENELALKSLAWSDLAEDFDY
jgi:hypothetical protein